MYIISNIKQILYAKANDLDDINAILKNAVNLLIF